MTLPSKSVPMAWLVRSRISQEPVVRSSGSVLPFLSGRCWRMRLPTSIHSRSSGTGHAAGDADKDDSPVWLLRRMELLKGPLRVVPDLCRLAPIRSQPDEARFRYLHGRLSYSHQRLYRG